MKVNVGTIGHIDHGITTLSAALIPAIVKASKEAPAPKRVLVVDNGLTSSRTLAMLSALVPGFADMLPDLPAPKPARRLASADLERIEAAEAKRQRRIERNRKQGSAA